MTKRIKALSRKETERFWNRVNKGTPDECWEWDHPQPGGYGRIHIQGKLRLAHRVSYFIEYGRNPGKVCMHTCDNPSCVNPTHLKSADHGQNARDRTRKDRDNRRHFTPEQVQNIRNELATGEITQAAIAFREGVTRATICLLANGKNYKTPGPDKKVNTPHYLRKGTHNGRAKLNEEQVKEIRARYKTGKISSIQLAAEYRVSKPTILDVIHLRKWSHVS